MSWGIADGTGYSGYNINFFDGAMLMASDAYVPAADEVLSSVDVYCYDTAGGADIVVGVYDITGGNDSATLVASATVSIPVAGGLAWVNAALSGTLTAGRTYARALCKTSSETAFIGRASSSSYSRNQTASVTSLPTPYGAGHGNYSYNFAIYVNSAPSGPSFTSITDPIDSSISGTVSEAVTATHYRVSAGGTSANIEIPGGPITDTSFAVTGIDRENLPFIANAADTGAPATVSLTNGETVLVSTTADLVTAAGTTAHIVTNPDLSSAHSIFNPLYCDTTPEDGQDQFWYTGDPGVSIAANGEVTGEGGFTLQAWDKSALLRGAIASYTISGGVIYPRSPVGRSPVGVSPIGKSPKGIAA